MPACKEKIFVFGASGHARVVIDVLEKQGRFTVSCIFDDDKQFKGKRFCNYPVIGGRQELLLNKSTPTMGIVAIGCNKIRCAISQWLVEHGYELISAVHPSAQIGRDVEIGSGSVIMANAAVNSSTTIGRYVIINTGATVDHDCVIGEGGHIAPGSVICGTVAIGEESFLGAGSVVINNTVVGKKVMIGAGTTIYRDIPDKSKIVGTR